MTKRRRISGTDYGPLVWIGGGIALLYFGSKILGQVLPGTPNYDAEVNAPPSQNPFSVTFGQDYNAANNNDPNIAALVAAANNQAGQQSVTDGGVFSNSGNITQDTATLYNAFGVLWDTDDNSINTVYADLTSQYSVSLLAQMIKAANNIDLWTLMNNGRSIWPGMSVGAKYNLQPILAHIQSLPVYPPQWNV